MRAVLFLVGSLAIAEPRQIAILFGPSSASAARTAARSLAGLTRQFVAKDSSAALHTIGQLDPLPLSPGTPVQPFLEAAQAASETAPSAFWTALEAAAQHLTLAGGQRLLLAPFERFPVSGDLEDASRDFIRFCQSHHVRLIVFPSARLAKGAAPHLLDEVALQTGGGIVHTTAELQHLLTALPAAPTRANTTVTPTASVDLARDLPVSIRFLGGSPMRTAAFGTQRSFSSGRGGITTSEGGPNIELSAGPARGTLILAVPQSALRFDIDQASESFLARATLTELVRDKSGREVWQAHKEVTLRGPLAQLEARKGGTLYLAREVQLPAGDYTVEGRVEDLLANKRGGAREQLRTAPNLPGFAVSDAVFVRGFDRRKDRLEADQVFAYDGEALAPILEPTFPADEPFDLDLFVTLFPRITGEQPELSLELLRDGHSAGRLSLPFTDKLSDASREGIGAIQGEQKRQFPYRATLRNARLTPGRYEAKLTVRQGRQVLARSAFFAVTGESSAAPGIPTASGTSSSEPDPDPLVVMPELDPASIERHGPEMPPTEQQRLWQEAAERAMAYTASLPSFRCRQEVRRLVASTRQPGQFKEADVIVNQLLFEDGKERYRTVEINGLKANKDPRDVGGVQSRGEFGTMLRGLFQHDVAAKYSWAGQSMVDGVLCRVFDIEVEASKSNWVLNASLLQEVPGYKGRVFIDEETGMVRKLTMEGVGLRKTFPLQSPSLSLEYGVVRIGSEDVLVPVRSVLQMRKGRQIVRNESRFVDYRKFGGESQIHYELPK